jgi:hypothetical protein
MVSISSSASPRSRCVGVFIFGNIGGVLIVAVIFALDDVHDLLGDRRGGDAVLRVVAYCISRRRFRLVNPVCIEGVIFFGVTLWTVPPRLRAARPASE